MGLLLASFPCCLCTYYVPDVVLGAVAGGQEVQVPALGLIGFCIDTRHIVGAYIPEHPLCVWPGLGTCNALVGFISGHLYSACPFAHINLTPVGWVLFSCVKGEKPEAQLG